ncbi:MAG: hypothetical protein O7D91_08155 [Planctomycetota bacterium]|nr:hypothetical protein [Planctomycetota bacterium]
MSRINLVMKYNNACCRESCLLCGESTKPPVGPAVFMERTWSAVCDACAKECAPGLHATMKVIHEMEHLFRPLGGVFAEIDVERLKGNGELLRKLLHKPTNIFKQFDGFVVTEPDDVMRPNEQGHCWMEGETVELMSTCPEVRVLIPPGTKRDDAIALLRGIISSIEAGDHILKEKDMLCLADKIALGHEPSLRAAPFGDCGDLDRGAALAAVMAGT